MSVTKPPRPVSVLRNAYVSVLSANGSAVISGASRWLEAREFVGFGPNVNEAIKANNSKANASRLADGFLMSLYSFVY